jgi:hypothetical protein
MAREETVEYPELRHVFASSELVDLRVHHHRKFHRVSRADPPDMRDYAPWLVWPQCHT